MRLQPRKETDANTIHIHIHIHLHRHTGDMHKAITNTHNTRTHTVSDFESFALKIALSLAQEIAVSHGDCGAEYQCMVQLYPGGDH